jgi:hypothetical protein
MRALCGHSSLIGWNLFGWYCSFPLKWQVWSRKKVLYYSNVMLCILWHFGFKCCIIEGSQEYGLFQCIMSFCFTTHIHKYERTFVLEKNAHIVTQYGLKNMYVMSWWCRYHIHLTEIEIFLSSNDVCWYWKLTSCSINSWKIACTPHLQLKSFEGCFDNLSEFGTHKLFLALVSSFIGHSKMNQSHPYCKYFPAP